MSNVVIAGRGHCCDPFSALKEEIDMAVTIAMNARNIAERALESSVKSMIYKGTVGTGGTIESLPVADETNIGWTYLAITAGSTPDDTPKSYEIGDMIISNGEEWTVVPAGDDPVLWSDIQNKPTTLSGYGITDAVTLNTAQTITGSKTFTSEIAVQSSNYPKCYLKDTDSYIGDNTLGELGTVQGIDKDNKRLVEFRMYKNYSSGLGEYTMGRIIAYNPANLNQNGMLTVNVSNTDRWATAPYRTYNSANTEDIVTIGSLASNPSVVHTTGNETLSGEKTFVNAMKVRNVRHAIYADEGTGYSQTVLTSVSPDENTEIRLFLASRDDGTVKLELGKWHNGAYVTSTVVATL